MANRIAIIPSSRRSRSWDSWQILPDYLANCTFPKVFSHSNSMGFDVLLHRSCQHEMNVRMLVFSCRPAYHLASAQQDWMTDCWEFPTCLQEFRRCKAVHKVDPVFLAHSYGHAPVQVLHIFRQQFWSLKQLTSCLDRYIWTRRLSSMNLYVILQRWTQHLAIHMFQGLIAFNLCANIHSQSVCC